MPNQLGGQTGPSPRCYSKHLRRGRFARTDITRVKHAPGQFATFLTTQATRLSSTATVIFTKLKKYSAARIKAAANLGQIP